MHFTPLNNTTPPSPHHRTPNTPHHRTPNTPAHPPSTHMWMIPHMPSPSPLLPGLPILGLCWAYTGPVLYGIIFLCCCLHLTRAILHIQELGVPIYYLIVLGTNLRQKIAQILFWSIQRVSVTHNVVMIIEMFGKHTGSERKITRIITSGLSFVAEPDQRFCFPVSRSGSRSGSWSGSYLLYDKNMLTK